MKFETYTHELVLNLKIRKPEVATKIQDGHLEFHIIGCHFIPNCPISTKFCTQMPQEVSQTKHLKLESYFDIQDGGGGHLGF
jgi:ABC-type antimicrobial peptide transport system ATPase subunit